MVHAMARLRERFKFGSWHHLQDQPRHYGGRTLSQKADFSFTIDMNRYLKERAHEIKIGKGRKAADQATPSEITGGRGAHGIAELGDA